MAGKRRYRQSERALRAERKRKRRRRKRAAFIIAELLILMVLSGVAFAVVKFNKFQTVSLDDKEIKVNKGVKKEGYTTFALFGGDSRDGLLEEGTHADCIIIAAIDNETSEVRLASVYRDTLLQMADGSYAKANFSYFNGGPAEAINMLNENLDLAIQDYATVDFKALTDTIDLLGGIEIDVKEEEIEALNKYVYETATVSQTAAVEVTAPGLQLLNGAQATTYARIRSTAGGDWTRTERQRLVIQKVFEKAKTMNLITLNKIIDKVFPQVSTSLKMTDVIGLASHAAEYKLGETTGFPMELENDTFSETGNVNIPMELDNNVESLHAFLYPKHTYSVSQSVQTISDGIVNYTGYAKVEPVEDSGYDSGYTDESGGYTSETDTADNGYTDMGDGYDNGSAGNQY